MTTGDGQSLGCLEPRDEPAAFGQGDALFAKPRDIGAHRVAMSAGSPVEIVEQPDRHLVDRRTPPGRHVGTGGIERYEMLRTAERAGGPRSGTPGSHHVFHPGLQNMGGPVRTAT